MKKGNRQWKRATHSVSGMLISGHGRKITGYRWWGKEQIGRDIEDRGKGEIRNGVRLLLHPPITQKVIGRWYPQPRKRDPTKITRAGRDEKSLHVPRKQWLSLALMGNQLPWDLEWAVDHTMGKVIQVELNCSAPSFAEQDAYTCTLKVKTKLI